MSFYLIFIIIAFVIFIVAASIIFEINKDNTSTAIMWVWRLMGIIAAALILMCIISQKII